MTNHIEDNIMLGLEIFVPVWIAELARLDTPAREATRTRWAAEAVEPIASRGDVLQYGGGKRGGVFNHLARGLAALAFAPGGVTWGVGGDRQHWCVNHAECLAAEAGITRPVHAPRTPPARMACSGRRLETITPTGGLL